MKAQLRRILALCLALLLMAGSLSACGGASEQDEIGVLEQGSEEELTAVRASLIKKTEIEGLGDITKMELYENGVRTTSDTYVQVKDNKKIYYAGDIKRVVNYPDGYILDIPQDWVPDYSMASVRVRYVTDEVTMIGTNEDAIYGNYGTAEDYIHTIFQYITASDYQRANGVKKVSEETITLSDDFKAYVLRMRLLGCDENVKSHYTYVVYYNGVNRCVQLLFKAVDNRDFSAVYNSFRAIYDKGKAVDTITYPCRDNPSWNADTKAFYESLNTSDTITWGLFAGNVSSDEVFDNGLPAVEDPLDFSFPLISSYSGITKAGEGDFPLDGARRLTEEGRRFQFTLHFSYWGTETGMGKKAPILEVYRGSYDESLAATARQIVEYGQPLLFRLNNEMNSDWTDWAAVNCMLDPEIFTETWIRLYEIFEREGANAYCIWIWNPQSDRSYPIANWNEIRTYMPGADYVDMIGLTYYNFGDENTWGTYQELYSWVDRYYSTYFADWAWIISEFGCSDTQTPSRKPQWITEMFDCMEQGMFENIKAAVWFSCNDYENGEITHLLVLDESKEVLAAFKEGLERTQ